MMGYPGSRKKVESDNTNATAGKWVGWRDLQREEVIVDIEWLAMEGTS